MPTFDYVAVNRFGKQVRSSVEAATIETAKSSLRATGLTIMEIKPQSVVNRDIDLPFMGKPSSKDMALFCRQFVSILRAGVPIGSVLTMLSQQTENKKLCTAIRNMKADVEKGDTLAGSMRRQPEIFPSMMVNMVSAGEGSGNLEDAFTQLEIYFERARRAKSKVSKVMVYPSVLMVVMVIVLIVMMVKIIPMFLASFEDMGAELPKLTLMVMAVSDWFVAWWWAVVLGIIGLVVFCVLFKKTDKGRHFFGFLALKVPIFRNLTEKSACATLCRSVSVLLGSGLTLTESLALTGGNMTNIYYAEALQRIRYSIAEGETLSLALTSEKLFPPMVCNLVGIGEETGNLEEMMAKIADYYDEEVSDATDKLMSLLEPCIILFLAVFVVIIVFSIFLPMMSMTSAYDSYL